MFHHNKIYDECSVEGRKILQHMNLPIPTEQLFKMKCFEVIDALFLNFYEGNCIKYLWRLGEKDNYYSDLEKAYIYAVAACERISNYTFFYDLKTYIEQINDFSGLADKRIV